MIMKMMVGFLVEAFPKLFQQKILSLIKILLIIIINNKILKIHKIKINPKIKMLVMQKIISKAK